MPAPLPRPLIGWPLLPVPDESGQLQFPSLDDSVRQSIKIILRTRPGEQLRRPHFGAGLEEFVHEQNTLATRRRIRDVITEALTRWEPRITLDRVSVFDDQDHPTHVRVVIAYRLRRTGAAQQVGLGITLEG
jgi:phage baseplate assembly protein W